MRSAQESRSGPGIGGESRTRAIFTFIFLAAGSAEAIAPEAQDVLDALDRRIAAAEAGQASREAFLEALASQEEDAGCGDWARQAFWKRDPALKSALLEACPALLEKPPGRPSRGGRVRGPRARLGASQDVRPRDAEAAAPPRLGGALDAPVRGPAALRAGGDFATLETGVSRRRSWLAGPAWGLQAGTLRFAPEGPMDSAESSMAAMAAKDPDLPRLAFVGGRRSWAGSRVRSGLEGPLEAGSAALDGLGVSRRGRGWEAGGFGSWNRLRLEDAGGADLRGDAGAFSLAAAGGGGDFGWALQAVHARLEAATGSLAAAMTAGGELAWRPAGLRLGAAGSGLWAPGSGAVHPGSPVPGAYGEVSWDGGKPESYLLELRQATPGWAAPLAAVPAPARDTAGPGLRLPGRGAGGFAGRSRASLLEAEGFRAEALADLEAAWTLEGDSADPFLSGEGRFALAAVLGPAAARSGFALTWRRAGLPGAGQRRVLSQSLGWEGRRWRARASLSRSHGSDDQERWPFSLEASRRHAAGSWRAAWSTADLGDPGSEHRLHLAQAWRMGSGLSLGQSLRVPMEGGETGTGLMYRLDLEWSGR